jgi:hypothetical protein
MHCTYTDAGILPGTAADSKFVTSWTENFLWPQHPVRHDRYDAGAIGLEGLTSGPVLTVCSLVLGLGTLICTLVPQRINLRGGVMHQKHVMPCVLSYAQRSTTTPRSQNSLRSATTMPPALGDQASGLGRVALVYTVQSQSYSCSWLCGIRY